MKTRFSFGMLAAVVTVAMTGCQSGSGPTAPGSTVPKITVPGSTTPGPTSGIASCTGDGLGKRFQGGAFGGGFVTGIIEVWNPGDTPCQVSGTVTFTAQTASGATEPNAKANRTQKISLTLPAQMKPPAEGSDQHGYLVADLSGFYRDDSQQPDGLCKPQDEVTPATLVLSIGGLTVRVPNEDPAISSTDQGVSRTVYGCHGNIVLETVAVR
ncbi:hypothetical protein [Pseudofrankia sp. DC12]|uniref:hypothetical protein n=1 Tax=Pseudofrankia sp. DC12 TaxID=683315 RepID=UPI000A4EA308|nr:hypothetical protein [Pseudofrankia sp. DC12]